MYLHEFVEQKDALDWYSAGAPYQQVIQVVVHSGSKMTPFYPDKIGLAVDPTNERHLSLYLKSEQMATHERIYPDLAEVFGGHNTYIS